MPNPVLGGKELDAKFVELSKVGRGRVLRSAVRAGIRPAERRAKDLIPQGSVAHRTYKGRLVGPGFASRNIRVITVLARDRYGAAAIMGVRREAFYAVQYVERRVGKSKDTGREWLGPAMEQTQGQQVEALLKQLQKRILAAAKGAKVVE